MKVFIFIGNYETRLSEKKYLKLTGRLSNNIPLYKSENRNKAPRKWW